MSSMMFAISPDVSGSLIDSDCDRDDGMIPGFQLGSLHLRPFLFGT